MAINSLQLPQFQGNSQVDFSSLAQLPQIYQQGQKRAMLSELAQSGNINNPQALIRAGMQTGDMTLANLGVGMLNRQQQEARQATQDARQLERDKVTDTRADRQFAAQQAYQNRSLGLQEANLREKPTIQKVKDAAGNETLVQVYPDGRTRALSPGEAAAAGGDGPANPFAPNGKQTEGQANAGLYAGRMFQAEKILNDPKSVAAAMSNTQRSIDQAPIFGSSGMTGLGNYLQSEDYQKFDQAQRNFINATLRRESGATIQPAEFENAAKQYFPRPGDSAAVIEQKRKNRMEAIRGIAGAAGPSWRAPATFDDSGNIQDRAPRPTGGPKVGQVQDGYRFKGGNPGDPASWVKVQ